MHTILYMCTCNFNFMSSIAHNNDMKGLVNFQIITNGFHMCGINSLLPQNLSYFTV